MAHAMENEAKDKMSKCVESFKQEMGHIRTGRASTGLLDTVEVEVYGTKMKINQIGNVTAPEPRLLVITPWDKSQLHAIEKAIMSSPLDMMPSNDGNVIRLPFPPLTEQRRKELVKMVGKLEEEAKISIRNVRRHIVDTIKKDQKDGKIPEDEAHKLSDSIQKITDDFCAKVDEAFKAKQEEIMEV